MSTSSSNPEFKGLDLPEGAPSMAEVAPRDAFKPVSRRSATLWNMFFFCVDLGLIFARNLAFIPLYLRYISDDEYGAWMGTGGILAYLMNDFGLLAVVIQQIAVAYGNRDRERLQRLAGTGLALSFALSVIIALVGVSIAPFISRWVVELKPAEAQRLMHCFAIVAVANGGELISLCMAGIQRSLQRSFLPGLLRVLSELSGLLLTLYLVVHGWGLYGIAWGLVLRTSLSMIGNLSGFLWVAYSHLGIHLQCAWQQVRDLWQLSIYQFVATLASRIKFGLDPLLITVILGPIPTLSYALTTRAHEMVRMLVETFGKAALPSLAHLHGEGRADRFKHIVITIAKLQVMMASIGMVGVITFNSWFVRLWVGPDRFAGHKVTVLVAIWGMLYFASMISYFSMQAMGEFRIMCKFVWLDAIIRIPLSIIFVYSIGLWGAPMAALVAQFVAFWWLFSKLLSRLEMTTSELNTLAYAMGKLMVGPVVAGVVLKWADGALGGWYPFAAKAGLFVFLAMVISLVMEPGLAKILRSRGRIEAAGAPA